jgi:glutathione S-transferase
MDVATRAAKLADLYKHLVWMEHQIRLPYMAGSRISHADCTWFPTCVFMELLLPYVFDWSPIFHETVHFPKWSQWFATCFQNPHVEQTYQEIHQTLKRHQALGRFELVKQVVQQHAEFQWKYM